MSEEGMGVRGRGIGGGERQRRCRLRQRKIERGRGDSGGERETRGRERDLPYTVDSDETTSPTHPLSSDRLERAPHVFPQALSHSKQTPTEDEKDDTPKAESTRRAK